MQAIQGKQEGVEKQLKVVYEKAQKDMDRLLEEAVKRKEDMQVINVVMMCVQEEYERVRQEVKQKRADNDDMVARNN